MDLLTPPRRRTLERLDAPDVSPALVARSLRDVSLSNTLFGGTHAVMCELDDALRDAPSTLTLLDVGTGLGDIPAQAIARARRRGIALTAFGLDQQDILARSSAQRGALALIGDALSLPFADASIDIVMCSQVLHHFEDDAARRLIAEMNRVARRRVIVSDLQRTRLAAAGIWLASWPLLFHPVSRHDGVLSVLKGFQKRELETLVSDAVGVRARAALRLMFRVTISWPPAHPSRVS